MHTWGKSHSEAELQSMMSSMDTDGNGMIDFPEFLESMRWTKHGRKFDKELHEALSLFGRDGGSTFIDKKE
jgi:Ca2+-binding EF-hand superfamily protein